MKKRKKRVLTSLFVLLLVSVTVLQVFAATEHWNDASLYTGTTATHLGNTSFAKWAESWDDTKTNFEQLALTPGKMHTQMNFAWYSRSADSATVRISKTEDMHTPVLFDGAAGRGTVVDGIPYYSNKVTATGLSRSTTYYYQYKLNGKWQETASFRTGDPDSFQFLYVGDPQIGASKTQVPANYNGGEAQSTDIAARNDSYNWAVTLNAAVKANPSLAFVLSAGDQVNEYVKDGSAEKILQQEYEYAGFLAPNALKSLPVATTIGNHDSMTQAYRGHFNVPNNFTEGVGGTPAGNGYYYSYGNALFVFLNLNNYNCADHKALIDKAVKSHPNATWKVVTIHQDIYGTGLDHSDSDGIILRTQLTPIFDEYGIDVVLQGHDHTYSRSHHLTGNTSELVKYDSDVNLDDEAVNAKFLQDNLCYNVVDSANRKVRVNPVGTLYLSANSATGSKFYELIPTRQDYIATRSQTWTPTYSVIDVDATSFTVTTYDVATGRAIDSGYKIIKQ